MAGWLTFIFMLLCLYTIFAPVATLDIKHLRNGLLLLLALGIFAYINYLFGVL